MGALLCQEPTWLNPVDTRCSWVPVHTSRPSLLFSWARVLCRKQEMVLSPWASWVGYQPESPMAGRRGQVGAPEVSWGQGAGDS